MDIFAHALWTNAVFEGVALKQNKKRPKKDTLIAILFGIAPDLFAFSYYFASTISSKIALWPYAGARLEEQVQKVAGEMSGFAPQLAARIDNLSNRFPHLLPNKPPDPSIIPQYVHTLYNISHSLVIFLAVFLIVWLIRKKPYWLMGGWVLHIGIDMFSHTREFFGTPFLFPVSSYLSNGWSWADPNFMLINYALLLCAYIWIHHVRTKKKKKETASAHE